MKKFLAFALLALMTAAFVPADSQAQVLAMQVSAADDTLVNTQTGNLTLRVDGFRDVITFELRVARTAGTAGGTATLQGSLDGTNWYNIGSAYTITNAASQGNTWVVNPSSYQFYRINVAHNGAGTVVPTGRALIRRQ